MAKIINKKIPTGPDGHSYIMGICSICGPSIGQVKVILVDKKKLCNIHYMRYQENNLSKDVEKNKDKLENWFRKIGIKT